MIIRVAEAIGRIAVTHDAGSRLFKMIHTPLSQSEDITLDFAGVSVYSSPFFNYSIGRLFADIDPKIIRSHLTMENLSQTGDETIRSVVENALHYYSMTKEQREQLDHVNRHMIDGPDSDQ